MTRILETQHLHLVPLSHTHLDDLFAVFSDPEVMQFYDSYPHQSREATRTLLELFLAREEKGTGFRRGIVLAGTERVIGTIGFNFWMKGRGSDVGYDLARAHWGKGIITEALAAVIRYGFDELEVHRIQADILPTNTASERVLLKNGFVREGVLRDKYFFRDAHQTVVAFSRLRTDPDVSNP